MKINEMNIVITGANGSVASVLMEYFSGRAAFVIGTVRRLANNVEQKNSAIIEMDPLDHPSIERAISPINDEV